MKKVNKASKSRNGILIVTIVVLLLCGIIMAGGYNLSKKIAAYDVTQAQIEEQIAEQKNRKEEIEEKTQNMQSEEYIKELAREKLGLIVPGEIVFRKSGY